MDVVRRIGLRPISSREHRSIGLDRDSGALRSVRVPNLKLRAISVAFWHSAASAAFESGAVQAPAHHRRFDDAAGLMIAPFAIDPPARERQLISPAVVLA